MKKLALILTSLLLFNTSICYADIDNRESLTGQVTVTAEKKDPKLIHLANTKPINPVAYKKKLANDINIENTYKKPLKEEFGKLYTILERIVRANRLEFQNWRFTINSDVTELNAFATSVNLIVINSALYDCIYQDDDALAFVMSHEIAHLMLNHQQAGIENAHRLNQIRKELRRMGVISRQHENITLINTSRGYSSAESTASALGANIRIRMLYNEANRIYKEMRQREFEADSEAINIMTRAGYDSSGAISALNFMSRIPDVYTDKSTHPPIEKRCENVNDIVSLTDTEELKRQGEQNLYNTKVLTVKRSSDKKALIIERGNLKSNLYFKPETKYDKYLLLGYRNYINNNFAEAKSNFIKAYKLNKKDYIPALYLSYINEYEYKYITKDPKSLKKAGYWLKKSKKANEEDSNVLRQKQDLIELVKERRASN